MRADVVAGDPWRAMCDYRMKVQENAKLVKIKETLGTRVASGNRQATPHKKEVLIAVATYVRVHPMSWARTKQTHMPV